MIKDREAVQVKNNAKGIVLAFIDAMNDRNYDQARSYVNDNMTFMGVLGARNGADAYFDDMQRMKFRYDIKKVFTDDNSVCLLYDIDMSGTKIFTCGWYTLVNGKISSLRVVFDPRPVLEAVGK